MMKSFKALLIILPLLIAGIVSQVPQSKGVSTQNPGNYDNRVTFELRSDGSYSLTVTLNAAVSKEEVSVRHDLLVIFLKNEIIKGINPAEKLNLLNMVNQENAQVEISYSKPDQIQTDMDIRICFTEIGLRYLDILLKKKIPGKPSDLIPATYRILLSMISENAIPKINEHPILLLPLSQAIKDPENLITGISSKKLEGKSIQDFLETSEAKIILPVENLQYLAPNLKIGNLRFTEFSWNESLRELELGFVIFLSKSQGGKIELRKALPVTIETSLNNSVFKDNRWSARLRINSGACIPGFKKNEFWTLRLPSKAQLLYDQLELSEILEGENAAFEIKIPKKAEIRNLPGKPDELDEGTFVWTGENAASALNSIATGESNTQVKCFGKGPSEEGIPILWILAGIVIAASIGAGVYFSRIREQG